MLGMGGEMWAGVGSTAASLMFLWAVARQFLPHQFDTYVTKYVNKLLHLYYPYMVITFSEHSGERLKRSEAYAAIEAYLAASCSQHAQRLKAELGHDSTNLTFSMEDYEEVTDEFRGAKLWWTSQSVTPQNPSISFFDRMPDERRYYRVTFHRGNRHLVTDSYLPYVMKEGKAIKVQKRRRKMYTNQSHMDWSEYKKLSWSHVPLEHPATFETLAMEPDRKEELIQDLLTFSKSKDYYSKVGKPWKRGYLLHGPPGTGKSTLIAAMANLLDYDVYDIELTAVKNNTALKKLLIETASKSIIVMEDIDCSLDLSGKRKKATEEEEEEKKVVETAANGRSDKEDSKVTLSGLLNFIDGLWSSCGGERLIVFTTNYVEKLDPALIRRGRMDVHVNLSYCSFGGFKVLARNYLGIESHALFDDIRRLMEEKDITPADVAENLMPKNLRDQDGHHDDYIETSLKSLVAALEDCKNKGAGIDDDKISIGESGQEDKSSQDDKEEAKSGQDGKEGECSA